MQNYRIHILWDREWKQKVPRPLFKIDISTWKKKRNHRDKEEPKKEIMSTTERVFHLIWSWRRYWEGYLGFIGLTRLGFRQDALFSFFWSVFYRPPLQETILHGSSPMARRKLSSGWRRDQKHLLVRSFYIR